MFRLKVENVATPFTAATALVPARIPLAGFVPIATVTLVVAVVTVLPWASWTVTCTAGVFIAPAAALLGCTVKTTFAAGPTPVGWTGSEVLPEHPARATPHSTTPIQNTPRAGLTDQRELLRISIGDPLPEDTNRRFGSSRISCDPCARSRVEFLYRRTEHRPNVTVM